MDTITSRLGWVIGFAGSMLACMIFGTGLRKMYVVHTTPPDLANLIFVCLLVWLPFRAAEYVLSGK